MKCQMFNDLPEKEHCKENAIAKIGVDRDYLYLCKEDLILEFESFLENEMETGTFIVEKITN